MPNNATVFAWNKLSNSARLLATELDAIGVKSRKSSLQTWPNASTSAKYYCATTDVCISWGAKLPTILLSEPKKTLNANSCTYSDKLHFLNWARKEELYPYTPRFTTNYNELIAELANGASPWVARLTTKAYGGKGIVLLDPSDPSLSVPKAPLYTRYIKKSSEYRVHFVKNKDEIRYYFQKKKRIKEAPVTDITFKVRNLSNGWVYSSINFEMPQRVKETAAIFAKKIPLEFGALDIIFNEHDTFAYCLEVNTAPGLIQQTAAWYANCFKEMF